jgi:hypothetical protein
MRLAPCTGLCRRQEASVSDVSCMDGCAEAAAAQRKVGTFGPGTVWEDSRTKAGRWGCCRSKEA